MSSSAICFLNNRFLPYEEATIHVSDLAIQRGFGVFDFFREIDGRVPFLEDYLDRFFASSKEFGLEVPLGREKIRRNILHLLEVNRFQNSGIKLILTGGNSEDFLTPVRPNLVILNVPFKGLPDDYLGGIKLMLYEYQRFLSDIKSINYFLAVWLLPKLKAEGAIEPLFYYNGRILETSRGNIFLVKDEVISTPKDNILQGISRKHLLIVALEKYDVDEREVFVDEIHKADEIFITGTSKHVLPIVQIDDTVVADRKPGPVTSQLMEDFERYIIGSHP
jgi:D-alanine transaminase/branched-chain amino acid aminotransferase